MLHNNWPMLLNNFFNHDSFNEGNQHFFNQNSVAVPAVNIKENDDSYAIELAAPGMAKSDFKVEVDRDQLIISAEKRSESETNDEQANYQRREFSYQSFRRSFTLPQDVVDTDKINAQYTDGILSLNIPKREEALPKPAKLIEIA